MLQMLQCYKEKTEFYFYAMSSKTLQCYNVTKKRRQKKKIEFYFYTPKKD